MNIPDFENHLRDLEQRKSNGENFPLKIHEGNESKSLEDFEKYRITDRTEIPQPLPVITIEGEIISTAGALTVISGPSKSGKTGSTQVLLAGAISPDGNINDKFDGLEVEPNINGFAVPHIDTEQSRWKHQRNVKSILSRANFKTCPDHFLSYNLRQLSISEYEEVTSGICETAYKKFGGIYMIVIDGIADYIQDVNDAQESNAIVKFFEELAIKYSCPVLTVVHTNPGSDKERGHLGSQCQRKAESVLTVKCENGTSTIEPKFLRNAGMNNIPLIQYEYDPGKGYHVSTGKAFKQNQADKDAAKLTQFKELARRAFPPPNSYTYSDAIDQLMRASMKQERTAKDYFKTIKAMEFITQSGDLWRLNIDAVQ